MKKTVKKQSKKNSKKHIKKQSKNNCKKNIKNKSKKHKKNLSREHNTTFNIDLSQNVIDELFELQHDKSDGHVYGYISNNSINVKGFNNNANDSVFIPLHIEELGSIFLTYPTHKNTWLFHVNIFESFRRFFSNNQQPQNDYIISEKHICCFSIKGNSFIDIDSSKIARNVEYIKEINKKYIMIIIVTLGDKGLLKPEYSEKSMVELQELIIDEIDEINSKVNEIVNEIYPQLYVEFNVLV